MRSVGCGGWHSALLLSEGVVVAPERFDLATKEDCWATCTATIGCNAATWQISASGCGLRRIAEDSDATADFNYESIRACEPGVPLVAYLDSTPN